MQHGDAMNVKATAKVKVTLEVSGGSWGRECSLDQVFEQASKEALITVNRVIGNSHIIRIVGEPEVTGIITNPESQSIEDDET